METLQKVAIGKEIGELALRVIALTSAGRFGLYVAKKTGFAVGLVSGAAVGVFALSVIDGVAAIAEKVIMDTFKSVEEDDYDDPLSQDSDPNCPKNTDTDINTEESEDGKKSNDFGNFTI